MAKVTATAFKAALALAAAELTTMWQDDTKAEMAEDFKNPLHPSRNLNKFFITDPVTGISTPNDAYVDLFYAGNFPNVPKQSAVIGDRVPVLLTATVETAAAGDIVLTFDTSITRIEALSIGGVVTGDDKIIQRVINDAAVQTIKVDTAYILGDTITVSGIFFAGNNQVTLAAEVVTNNVS